MKCNAKNIYYEIKTLTLKGDLKEVLKTEILNNFCEYHELRNDEVSNWEVLEQALNTDCSNMIKTMTGQVDEACENYHGDYYNELLDKDLENRFEREWDDTMWELQLLDYNG